MRLIKIDYKFYNFLDFYLDTCLKVAFLKKFNPFQAVSMTQNGGIHDGKGSEQKAD